jgi:hypothetical protein
MKLNRKFSLERLEDRQMMAGDMAIGAFATTDSVLDRGVSVAPAVPAYSSNPGAAATLYLDFNGHFEAKWGNYSNIVTPVYSMDADTTTFASYELATIREVWQRVAEDFAPFNINVTTVNPGNFANGKALRVAIGGTSFDWYREAIVFGVAQYNSFTNSVPNTAYAFAQYNGNARLIADTVSQEAGHSFGLHHQSVVNANGILVEEYSPGTSAKSPLMGYNLESERSTWWNGISSFHNGANYVLQDDMAMIAAAKNGFSYRPDDHGNTLQNATQMGPTAHGAIAGQFGIIGANSDTDWFQFNVTNNGRMSLQVEVPMEIANLDAKLSLFRVEHQLVNGKVVYNYIQVATSDPTTSLNASLAANVTPGNYVAVVAGHGEYGDVGQYTLKGSLSPPISRNYLDAVVTSSLTTTAAAPTTPTTVGPSVESRSGLASGQQLLVTAMRVGATAPTLQPTPSLPMTSSLREAAVDEAFATRPRVKSHKLPYELFDLLAAG